MKTLAACALLATLVSVPAGAQKLSLTFDAIAKKATEKTELNLDGPALEMIKQTVLKSAGVDPSLYTSINEIGLHNYQFEKPGEYSDSDVEALRKQIAGAPGWSRVLNNQDKDENTEIYLLTQAGKPAGLLLIAAEEKELTVIHVIGAIQLAKLQELINSTIKFKDLAQE
jgi:hypothetical protein